MLGRADIKPTQARPCATCGVSFQRKRFASGRLEDFQAFHRRRYCSLSCANSQSKGGHSCSAMHVQARKHLGSSCESCGMTLELVVHHCDENWKNNEKDNLQTLCQSCHRSWHIMQRNAGVTPAGRKPALPASLSPAGLPPEWDACVPTATRSARQPRKRSSNA